jgi:4-amino-4-deoxy-L-arabinose transferase-like glycosyltransferase
MPAVAWAGAGLGSWRVGLLAAVALAGFPLFVLQARQLTSDLPACLGMALALGGLRRWAHAGAAGWGAFAGIAGLFIATAAAGVLGAALPLLVRLH